MINSLMEASFSMYALTCSYLYPIMAQFLLLSSCRNKMTEQIVGRNKEDLRPAWKERGLWVIVRAGSYIPLKDLHNVQPRGS